MAGVRTCLRFDSFCGVLGGTGPSFAAMEKNRFNMRNRREFLKACLAGGTIIQARPQTLLGAASRLLPGAYASQPATDPWSELPAILARIRPPVFPDRTFAVTQFGAAGDNKTDCTLAFQKAIAACHTAGGGRVIVPAGEFLTG